jgi:hypothetical protein
MVRAGSPSCALWHGSLLVLMTGWLACTPSEVSSPELKGPPAVRLEIVFGTDRVELVRTINLKELVEDEEGVPTKPGSDLTWDFSDLAGAAVTTGSALDTRQLRFDTLGQAETPSDPNAPKIQADSGTLLVEVPNVGGTLRLREPTGQLIGELAVERIVYDPDGGDGKSDIDFNTDLIGEKELITGNGERQGHFNLLFVPEGYTSDELDKFHTDVEAMVDLLKKSSVINLHADQINAWRQDIQSAQSGISDPKLMENKDTAFNLSFGNDTSRPRRCVWPSDSWSSISVASVSKLKDMVAADVVIIVANTAEYGGCASRADRMITTSTNSSSAQVMIHELGHALFGLADEYNGSYSTCSAGPNLTQSLAAIPWRDLISATTPIPTSLLDGETKVGAFTGGGYCSTGIWRPQHNCLMRSLGLPYCKVCARHIAAKFKELGELPGMGCTPATVTSATASADNGNVAQGAIDKDAATRWSSLGVGQWIQLDLGAPTKVSGLDIAWFRGDLRRSNYVIEGSLDGTTFNTLATGVTSGTTIEKERINFAPYEARHIKVTVNGNSVTLWASIIDIDVCTATTP